MKKRYGFDSLSFTTNGRCELNRKMLNASALFALITRQKFTVCNNVNDVTFTVNYDPDNLNFYLEFQKHFDWGEGAESIKFIIVAYEPESLSKIFVDWVREWIWLMLNLPFLEPSEIESLELQFGKIMPFEI